MIRALTLTLTGWGLVVATALVHGVWTHRWLPNDALRHAVARMDRIPRTVGDWDGRDQPFDASDYPEEVYGVGQVRTYVERSGGHVLTSYLTCGLPGPLSIHIPTLCFRGIGFRLAGEQKRLTVGGEALARPAEFWYGDFANTDSPAPEYLRIFWSWRAGDVWSAPESPRRALARHPFAYKMYVIRKARAVGEPLKSDPAVRFLNLMIPACEESLRTAP
jgi:hypothetical protein